MRKSLTAAGLDQTCTFDDLRHTFGARCAAFGTPMRNPHEWMGHKDIKTTQIHADYSASNREADVIAPAFTRETPTRWRSNKGFSSRVGGEWQVDVNAAGAEVDEAD
jgi:hypothetical protein